MTKTKERITIDEVLDKIKKYITNLDDIKRIKNAYLFAKDKHKGQVRKTGEDYIYHPLNVVSILTTVYVDTNTLIAAFLHDVFLEECDVTKEEIEREFGSDVCS